MDRENMPGTGLTREQKTGFVLLLIFGILTVGLGALQMRNTIYGPFVIRPEEKNLEIVLDDTARLQQIDTDQDGLNDYEELNFYETSPYIPDTDSDGIRDKVEIDRGSDPLCPEGETCTTSEDTPVVSSTPYIASPLSSETPDLSAIVGASGMASIDVETLLQDPKALREALRASGNIPADQLDAMDDVTLQALARQVFQNMSNSTSTGQ